MRRSVAVALACASALIAVPSRAAAADCRGADHLAPVAARAATLCLLNVERAARGLAPLRLDRRLSRAARAHSADMVAHRYFAHDSRDGTGFGARIARTGWTRHRRGWTIGENIAWGEGPLSTPASIVDAWMHSEGHRANILNCGFHVIGIGVATVAGSPHGIYWTQDFGDD